MEKVTKNNLTIISKSHAHLHTMKKTQAKFQTDRLKTVRGVALTRHPASMLTERRTDERTDERTEICTPVAHAKAGATKTCVVQKMQKKKKKKKKKKENDRVGNLDAGFQHVQLSSKFLKLLWNNSN